MVSILKSKFGMSIALKFLNLTLNLTEDGTSKFFAFTSFIKAWKHFKVKIIYMIIFESANLSSETQNDSHLHHQ
jgi:hypothetical protein